MVQANQVPQLDTVYEVAEEPAPQPDTIREGGVEDQEINHGVVSKDIEEGKAAYQPGGFHPVYIGDVFNDRYKVLNKIGYGQYSTVWLVKDLKAR